MDNILLIREFDKKFPNSSAKYGLFKCKCGREFEAEKSSVLKGRRTSCGVGNCHKNRADILGKKFGRLTVISHIDGTILYKCICDCGKETRAKASALRNGDHKSCGCLSIEIFRENFYLGKWKASINALFTSYKLGAEKRKLTFSLNREEFESFLQKDCFYCKAGPKNISSYGHRSSLEEPFKYNGIDRVDNKKGYSLENCVTCCKHCNYSKRKFDLNEWKEWIRMISQNLDNF